MVLSQVRGQASGVNIAYDDEMLQRLFASMDVKTRTKALKNAFKREAAYVRRIAVNNLRTSGVRSNRKLERGIKLAVFKRKTGFKVTIWRQAYRNNIPVLTFLEGGTSFRQLKKNQANRGKVKRYGYMAKTLEQTRDKVTDGLHAEVANSIIKEAQKYGCK